MSAAGDLFMDQYPELPRTPVPVEPYVSDAFYDKERIALRLGVEVTALDLQAGTVTLSDGGVIEFDRLVLATGARPRLPAIAGGDADGVLTLRHAADARAVRDRIAAANDVVVIGSSLGGWIGAELAAHDHDGRIAHLVLIDAVGIDAVGIDVPGEPITDFFALDARGVAAHSFHDSERFFTDPATLPAAELARMGGNRATMQALAGDPYMHDPTLRSRLSDVLTPTTVIWGESDRIATPAYGRAYAESFGTQAQLVLIPEAGHLPHIEQPAATRAVIDALVAQPARHASAGLPGLTRRGSEVGDRPVA